MMEIMIFNKSLRLLLYENLIENLVWFGITQSEASLK